MNLLIVGLILIASVQSAPVVPSNFTVFANLTQPIALASNAEEALLYSGLVYIQATNELCGEDVPVKTKDVIFQTLDSTYDQLKLPKMGEKKYCISGLANTKVISKKGLAAPVTPCLDSSLGDGGGITKGLSVSVSLSGELDIGMAMPLYNFISFSAGLSAGASVGLSLSHSCTVVAGDSIQMWITPMVGATDFQYRTYHKWRGQRHSFTDFKRVSGFEFPVGGFQPAVQCLKGEYADCGRMVSTSFQIPVKGFE